MSPRRPLDPIMIVRVKETKRGRPKKRLFDISELAAFLHCSRGTIYTLLDAGLPSYRVAAGSTGGLRFDVPRVLTWLEARREQRRDEDYE